MSIINNKCFFVDASTMSISPVSEIDVQTMSSFGEGMSIYGDQYSVTQVDQIQYDSDSFRLAIEKVHNIVQLTQEISVYVDGLWEVYAARCNLWADHFLVTLVKE